MSPCRVSESLIVCSPSGYVFRYVMRCGGCKTRRRFVVEAFVWHDPIVTCCGCGKDNIGGKPSKKRAALAKARWAAALPRAEVEAALAAEVAVYVGGEA